MAKRTTTVETQIVESKATVDVKSTLGEKLGYGLWTAAGLAFPPAFIGLGKHDERVKTRKKLQRRKMELEAERQQAEAEATKKVTKKKPVKTVKKTTAKAKAAPKKTTKSNR